MKTSLYAYMMIKRGCCLVAGENDSVFNGVLCCPAPDQAEQETDEALDP